MFEELKKIKKNKQILLAITVSFGLVCFWRGVWGLLDLYLFPNNFC